MHRVDDLWQTLVSAENCAAAIDEVNATHHWHNHHHPNRCTAWIELTKPERVAELQAILEDFHPAPYKVKRRYDPSAQKWRDTNEPRQWPDQYVHHALVRVLQPVMMRGMDPYACGSIRGRGTSYGRAAIRRWVSRDARGTRYCLQCDIRHFYPSLRPAVVMDRLRELVKDAKILDLASRIVADGVRIGAYPSQWLANTTLQPLDRLIRSLGVAHYVRYMDNFTVFASAKRVLRRVLRAIDGWLRERGMELKGDWQIFRVGTPDERGRLPQALGMRYGRTFMVPRKRVLFRLKRCLTRFRYRRDHALRVAVRVAAGIVSRLGQLASCSSVNLYRLLLRGEHVARQCKNIMRSFLREKECEQWSTYLAQKASLRFSKRRAASIPA